MSPTGSFRRKFIGILLPPVAVALIIASMALTYINYSQLKEDFSDKQQVLIKSFSSALIGPLWNFEVPDIQRVLDASIAEQDVIAAVVYDNDGSLIAKAGNSNRSRVKTVSFSIQHQGIVRSVNLGTLILTFSDTRLNEMVYRRIGENMLLLVIILGITITTATAINRSMVRELEQGVADRTHDLVEKNALISLMHEIVISANKPKNIDDVFQDCIVQICSYTGWPVGHVYICSEEYPDRLISTTIWHFEDEARFTDFKTITENTFFDRGEGLPGRILDSKQVEWIRDVGKDENFPRAKLTEEIWSYSGFGIPVLIDGDVVAVMEFFSISINEPDEALLNAASNIGTQIGQAIERGRKEEELRKARAEAELAYDAKSKFLAAASHDLRQPLHAMQLFAATLVAKLDKLGQQEPAGVSDLVGKLQLSIEALGGLLNSILDISRLDAGLVKPEIAEFALNDVLRQIVSTYAVKARQKEIDLRLVETSARVLSDEILLGRVISNLVSNAVRYTKNGKVLVGARWRGRQIRIEVHDTGPGFSQDDSDIIFDDFLQLDNPARQREQGMGLGLSIVRRTCDLLGYSVTVSSSVGNGACFAIDVPIAETAPIINKVETAEKFITPQFSPLILVIDDDPTVLDATESILEQWDCNVIAVASPEEAISYCQSGIKKPEVIIADFRLPGGKDGVDTIEHIRTYQKTNAFGIVVTADTSVDSLKKIEASGCELIHKPIQPEFLRSVLIDAFSEISIQENL